MREAAQGPASAPQAAGPRRLPLAWRLSLVMALVSALCCAVLGLAACMPTAPARAVMSTVGSVDQSATRAAKRLI